MSGARNWLWVVPLALLVTALLAVIATWSQARVIQSDLTSRSQAALASAGISGGEVSFDGRDATLRGFPTDKAQLAADVVRKVEGVRGADVAAQEKPAMTPSSEAPPSSSSGAGAPSPTSTPPAPGDGKKRLQAEIDDQLASQPIVFEPDASDLTDEGDAAVRRLAALIKKSEVNAKIEVDGHVAMGPGSERAALTLSQDRAKAVAKVLISNGVHADRVTWKGFGDSRPNSRGEDRRVDIKVG
jgi:outer membrane protein OmpA-like peptidoglycan-associated protein